MRCTHGATGVLAPWRRSDVCASGLGCWSSNGTASRHTVTHGAWSTEMLEGTCRIRIDLLPPAEVCAALAVACLGRGRHSRRGLGLLGPKRVFGWWWPSSRAFRQSFLHVCAMHLEHVWCMVLVCTCNAWCWCAAWRVTFMAWLGCGMQGEQPCVVAASVAHLLEHYRVDVEPHASLALFHLMMTTAYAVFSFSRLASFVATLLLCLHHQPACCAGLQLTCCVLAAGAVAAAT